MPAVTHTHTLTPVSLAHSALPKGEYCLYLCVVSCEINYSLAGIPFVRELAAFLMLQSEESCLRGILCNIIIGTPCLLAPCVCCLWLLGSDVA